MAAVKPWVKQLFMYRNGKIVINNAACTWMCIEDKYAFIESAPIKFRNSIETKDTCSYDEKAKTRHCTAIKKLFASKVIHFNRSAFNFDASSFHRWAADFKVSINSRETFTCNHQRSAHNTQTTRDWNKKKITKVFTSLRILCCARQQSCELCLTRSMSHHSRCRILVHYDSALRAAGVNTPPRWKTREVNEKQSRRNDADFRSPRGNDVRGNLSSSHWEKYCDLSSVFMHEANIMSASLSKPSI